jgi:hypothetical protein
MYVYISFFFRYCTGIVLFNRIYYSKIDNSVSSPQLGYHCLFVNIYLCMSLYLVIICLLTCLFFDYFSTSDIVVNEGTISEIFLNKVTRSLISLSQFMRKWNSPYPMTIIQEELINNYYIIFFSTCFVQVLYYLIEYIIQR